MLRSWPALNAAYREAQRRFLGKPGVCGIGLGRAFSESDGDYRGGLCIKVSVVKKMKTAEIRPADRIPGSITVSVPGSKRRARIPIDVVEIGSAKQAEAERPWPSAGALRVGRLFSFGRQTAPAGSTPFADGDAVLGTTGALLRAGQSWFATSAGHVFTETCKDKYDRPEGVRAVGCQDRSWERVQGADFSPATIKLGTRISDVMIFAVPAALRPDGGRGWPPGFAGKIATTKDIEAALDATTTTGFVWVERGAGIPTRIPIDLQEGLQHFKPLVRCGNQQVEFAYVFTWRCRFTEAANTLGGDSGAPVFLDAPEPRLLGFHFLEAGEYSYAMDALLFFRQYVGEPGTDFDFPL
jgi:hypothetical protein